VELDRAEAGLLALIAAFFRARRLGGAGGKAPLGALP
jgi:hypothetical protein